MKSNLLHFLGSFPVQESWWDPLPTPTPLQNLQDAFHFRDGSLLIITKIKSNVNGG